LDSSVVAVAVVNEASSPSIWRFAAAAASESVCHWWLIAETSLRLAIAKNGNSIGEMS
jgi:hypothetical protein